MQLTSKLILCLEKSKLAVQQSFITFDAFSLREFNSFTDLYSKQMLRLSAKRQLLRWEQAMLYDKSLMQLIKTIRLNMPV